MSIGPSGGDGRYDVVIVGSGVAGLSAALGLAGRRRVAVLTPATLGGGSTRWAQGGVAAALATGDTPDLHAADTCVAGAGLCDDPAVRLLTGEAPKGVRDLVAAGARFDREPDGSLALTREGGHHRRRVTHAGGDATGAEVSRALVAALRRADVEVLEQVTVSGLRRVQTAAGPQVVGVLAVDATSGAELTLDARAVVLATGGIGGLYETTTNPPDVTGDGIALALLAGATVVDMEFVQFHPTALRLAGATGQIPLVTEALRGEGAVLRDASGRRIMPGHHPMADLAPRDVVARRIAEVMAHTTGGAPDLVGLDATHLGAEVLRSRFPTVYTACRRHGVDPAVEPIPVAPAQHFLCGGIATDPWGASDVEGLYAVGEVAATGVHGANRLASNSLVEGMVFGRRVAHRLAGGLPRRTHSGVVSEARLAPCRPDVLAAVRETMSRAAGVCRDGATLAAARDAFGAAAGQASAVLVGAAVVTAALAREESRGCHWRADHPQPRAQWRRRLALRLGDTGLPEVAAAPRLERSA